MTRPAFALPAGLLAGAFIGLMLGGAWLNLRAGQVVDGDPFVLITGFPGWERAQAGPWRAGYVIAGIATVLTLLAALLFCLQHRLTQYGNAHFQTKREIRKGGLLEPAGHGLVFAKTGSPRSRAKFVAARYDRFPHCLVCAPTRAGKGVGYVIPNTLLFPGSCVILDVKGEIFAHTSRHRQAQGDAIYYFAPLDFTHGSHRYNPLERIAELTDTDQRFTELSKLASYFLTVSEKGGAGDFIVGARQLFVAAGMLAIERGRPTIGEITRILFDGADKTATYAAHAEKVRHPQSRIVFTNFSGYSDRTLSSYGSVLSGAGLGLWLNPKIDRVTSANDFSFRTLRSQPQSIYIIVESDDMVTLAPLLRLVFGELIATLRASLPDPQSEPWPVQIVLDEFDQLGHMPIIVQSLKQLAGHGARVSIITQSIPGHSDKLIQKVRHLGMEPRALPREFYYPALPLCMFDAVYSINVRYVQVGNVIRRFATWANWDLGIRSAEVARPGTHTVSEFLRLVEGLTGDEIAESVFGNRGRTSPINGILKADAVVKFSQTLVDAGIDDFPDLNPEAAMRCRNGSGAAPPLP